LRESAHSALCTFIGIGVRAELPDITLPEWKLDTPITYAGQMVPYISFNSYRRYAPEGGTALTTIFYSDTYDFWKKARDEGRYEQEKEALAEQVRRALCRKYPQCEGKIEVTDIATPLTYERYTGAYHGAWMGEMRVGDKMKQYPGNCEDISGLYFAGHRLTPPGGLPGALQTGRTAAQLCCRQFGVVFR
jgi:phytoene dehydrogenase-like protein